jgi:sterol desaturase/sphingolipid hydroxylase (fatty acid hydroxylase superfamily)
MVSAWGPWANRRYRLDKMTLRELVVAFFTHYSIIVYLTLATLAIVACIYVAEGPGAPLLSAALIAALYPLVEYIAHRFVLHSTFLYKSPLTAKVWKRIHYDHHQNPHDLSVLFGALYTTLPAIFLISMPIGWLVGGLPGALAGLATALLIFSGYEFCHCVQHLPFTPKNPWLRRIKRNHLAHHFHSEQGNFGITTNVWDRAFGTLYRQPRETPRSATSFNLGYAGEERERYPWVAQESLSEEEYSLRRTRRAG